MGLPGTRSARITRCRAHLIRSAFVISVVTSVMTAAPTAAVAAEPHHAAPTAADKVRDLAKRSADAYRRGDFKEAITLLDEAIAIDPQPVLYFNRGRAQEGLGNTDEAIKSYETYLEKDPNTRDRGAIEQRVATLKKQQEERVALEKAKAEQAQRDREGPPPSTPTPPPEPPRKRSIGPYIVMGAGVVGLAAGAVFGVTALGSKDDAKSEPIQRNAIDLRDDAESSATLSTVFFIVGGVLLAGGATWWVLDGRRVSGSRQRGDNNTNNNKIQVAIGPRFVGLTGVLP
jgi:tetratricopeptide (TPR) repeat protein